MQNKKKKNAKKEKKKKKGKIATSQSDWKKIEPLSLPTL